MAEKEWEVKPRGKKGKPPQVRGNIDPELTKQVGARLMYWYRLGNVKAVTDEEIAERLDHYFSRCFATGEIPLVETMSLALGYARGTLWDWEVGGVGSTPARRDLIKKAKELIASYDANMVSDGKLNPVTYIFRSKNYYGMKDQMDYIVSPGDPLGSLTDPDDIKKRLEEEIPEDIIIEE